MRYLLALILLLVPVIAEAKPVMILLTASWCPHCRYTEAQLGNLKQRPDVVVVDVDKKPNILAEYRAEVPANLWDKQTIPLTVIVDDTDGKLILTHVGRMTTTDVLAMMKKGGMRLDSKE